MTIDIISYTQEQFSRLNSEQIQEIKRVQSVKDRLQRRLEERKLDAKYRLSKAGMLRSGLWELTCQKLEAEYQAEVDVLRDGLLFYLQYSKQNDSTGVGYTVDYSLSIADRVILVKDYYVRTYSDVNERFRKFKLDGVAPSYLCESYASLYHWFWVDTDEARAQQGS